ncbi:MAG: VanZ family protein [Ruminococcus sp.]|nr:VanZ family protein [Ruminococcus sp.]
MNLHKKQVILRMLTTALTVLIVGFIFFQSLKPATESSSASGRVVALLNSITTALGLGQPFSQPFVRTCAHFTEFAVLSISTLAMLRTYSVKHKQGVLISTISTLIVAVCDECIQIFSDGRTFQLKDICVDFLGGISGCLLLLLILYIISKRKSRKS